MFILSQKRLTEFFDRHQYYTQGIPLKDGAIHKIIRYIQLDNYNQMIFDFGENVCLIVLKFFEENEQYDTCAEILKQIENHNCTVGTQIRTRL